MKPPSPSTAVILPETVNCRKHQSVEQSPEQSPEQSSEQISEQISEQSSEQSSEQGLEQSVEQSVEPEQLRSVSKLVVAVRREILNH